MIQNIYTKMGQKVHPLGFRRSAYKKNLGIPSMWSPDKATPSPLTLSFIRGSFEYGPRPVKGQDSYSKKLHEDFVIEGIVEEFFKKSGYIVTKLFVYRNFKELQISVGVFKPLEPLITPEKFGKAYGVETTFGSSEGRNDDRQSRAASNLDLEIDVLTKFLEKMVSSKVSINGEIFGLRQKEVNSFSKAPFSLLGSSEGRKSSNIGDQGAISVHHEVMNLMEGWVLTKNGKILPFESNVVRNYINILSKALKNYRKEFFFKNGLTILALCFLRPNAALLAKYMAFTMEDLPKGQTFMDFIGHGLGVLFQSQQSTSAGECVNEESPENAVALPTMLLGEKAKIKGILVKVKGRINGSDRSRIATYRFGSIPLHTIKAAIDYGFTFTKCSYGVSSIKVWFFVES